MQEVQTLQNKTPRWAIWAAVAGLGAVLAVLFWATWKSQFAAPPGYLFNTPTQPVEAGYCLAVAQSVMPGGAVTGGYFAEAADFWVKRLRHYGGDIAGAIAAGQAALARDLMAEPGPDRAWLQPAMERCSNRAVNYGARFAAFE